MQQLTFLLLPPQHLRKILEGSPPLVHDFIEGIRRTDRSNDDLVLPRRKAFVRLIGKRVEWHT